MTAVSRVGISTEIYLWVIKESRKDLKDIENRFKNIEAWIAQKAKPTFRQVENLARFLKVPLGYMFLSEPPKQNIIESEFRTIGNKMPEISKDLQDTLYSMGRKRDWLSEYRRENGWQKLIPDNFVGLSKDNVRPARGFLGLNEYWYKEHKDHRLAFKYLREKVESNGPIVMQSGIVGSNTHRKLSVKEFRGFLLYDDIAPLIFINSGDSETGKIFTLVHEFIHFLLRKDDIFVNEANSETSINAMTAEFLMPMSHVLERWEDDRPKMDQIEELSKLFHVSRLAMAIRLNGLGKIPRHMVVKVKQETDAVVEKRDAGPGGPSYYVTKRSRLGNSFPRAVIQGAESGRISYTHAFDLLDGSSKIYDYFKEEFIGYAE